MNAPSFLQRKTPRHARGILPAPVAEVAPRQPGSAGTGTCQTCTDADYGSRCTCPQDCGHSLCTATDEPGQAPAVPLAAPPSDGASEFPPSAQAAAADDFADAVTRAFAPAQAELTPPAAGDPAMTQAGLPLRQKPASIPVRPAAPPADRETLQGVIDGLRNLDKASGASLRCITAGDSPNLHIALRGSPSFAGVARLPDGTPMAGLWLDAQDEDGRLVIDALSVAWLGRLIDEAEKARERLYAVLNTAPGVAADGSEAA